MMFNTTKKSRQSDLALEKFWVTQYGWLQLCMTVAMEMTILIVGNCLFLGLRKTTMKN